MSSPFAQIRDFDRACLACRCEKQGCAVYLDGVPSPFHLIDLDHPRSPAGKVAKCDYLFLADGKAALFVAPIELKSSGIRPAKVRAQLQGGARVAERVAPHARTHFVPIAAHGVASLPHNVYRDMAKRRVSFRGESHQVQLTQCGDHLADVLEPVD